MSKVLEEALRLRKLGLAVHWLMPGEKRPVFSGWTNAPVMSVDELEASYREGYNVGFRAGKYSIVKDKEVCVLDVDVRGGAPYEAEAHAAARAIIGDDTFDVISGSGYGRHRYLGFPIGTSPLKAATSLRESDIWVGPDGVVVPPHTPGAKNAWVIELLSSGKNVVLPPSIHPDTGLPYKFI